MDLKSRLLNSVPQASAARTGADDQDRDGTASAVQAGPLSRPGGYRALSEPEREWQYRLHQELMTMIDLSVLTRMEEKDARVQVRELAGRLLRACLKITCTTTLSTARWCSSTHHGNRLFRFESFQVQHRSLECRLDRRWRPVRLQFSGLFAWSSQRSN